VPSREPASAALSTFTIRVDGSAIPGSYGVLSLEIAREVGRVPWAHLVLQDGDAAQQSFAISESDTFAPGAELEIDLGYDREEQTVFRGIVVRQRLDAPGRGASRLHVEARHACFRMARGRRSRAWVDVTDADAIGDLAAAAGLAFDGSSTGTRPQLFQHQASDWDFAVLRAERIGQLLSAELDGLRLFTADPAADPTLELAYGRNLFSFNLELDASDQAETAEVGA
jgi:phage protein D